MANTDEHKQRHKNQNVQAFFEHNRGRRLLSMYYTAGYPALEDTLRVASDLQSAGVDFLEIGIPYSDPVADGPVIQHSSTTALKNGMTLQHLFRQLEPLRETIRIPVFLMGYVNPILQYGVENFCRDCQRVGVQGAIIPDLPLYEYESLYAEVFERYGVHPVFLITPHTSEERIRKIDALSGAFIYMLSSPSVTGHELAMDENTIAYFTRVRDMQLRSPLVIGFGISGQAAFRTATEYAQGAIIGSRFVRLLGEGVNSAKISAFVASIRGRDEKK